MKPVYSLFLFGLMMFSYPAEASRPIPQSPNTALDRAARGLNVQIEDDLNKGGDTMLKAVRTTGCISRIEARGIKGVDYKSRGSIANHSWIMDWSKTEIAGIQDNFLFLRGANIQIALVTDGSDRKMAKLLKLYAAMEVKVKECMPQS